MILPFFLLLQGITPEAAAVMDRSRRQADERRISEAQDAEARAHVQPAPTSTLSPTDPAAQSALPIPPQYAARFQKCIDMAVDDADAALVEANAWQLAGGSFYARQCEGFAYARADRWTAAQASFRQAASMAEIANDPASARLWAQAGNAALADKDAAGARAAFDAAIAHGLHDGLEKGEAYLDRARAFVMLNDPEAARRDLDTALEQVPADPLAWLLSATLARRTGNLDVARAQIAKAVKLSPDDASVALEEGNIAILSGADDIARTAWTRATKLAPDSPSAKSATANLAQLAAAPATSTPSP